MGNCGANGQEVATDRLVNQQVHKDKQNLTRVHRVLLFGCDGSSKNTFYKQLAYIHNYNDLNKCRGLIYNICISSMHKLILEWRQNSEHEEKTKNDKRYKQVKHQDEQKLVECKMNYQITDKNTLDSISFIESVTFDMIMTKDIAKHIKQIWNDIAIKESYKNMSNDKMKPYKGTTFFSRHKNDNVSYFWDDISRIGNMIDINNDIDDDQDKSRKIRTKNNKEYVPTKEDIQVLHSILTPRSKIRRLHFNDKNNLFDIYDLGGICCKDEGYDDWNLSSKWIHMFDNIDAIIFTASLSCYNQSTDAYGFDDKTPMQRSLDLWQEVVNHKCFQDCVIVLILTKYDLFAESIKYHSLKKCFDEYNGRDGDASDARDYIQRQFEKAHYGEIRQVYCHSGSMIDANTVNRIWNDVCHMIVMRALQRNGML